MKQLGCVVLALGVAAVAFLAVVVLVIRNIDDQGGLTQQVDAVVVGSERTSKQPSGTGHDVEYRYRVDDQWYAGTVWWRNGDWSPGDEAVVCVDPEDPAQHVPSFRAGVCGSDVVTGSGIETGVPTTAP